MNRYSIGNIILFVVLAVVIVGGGWLVENYLIPKPPPPPPPEPPKPFREPVLALTGGGAVLATEMGDWRTAYRGEPSTVEKPAEPPKPVEPSEPHRLLALSGDGYNLKVLLSNKGAGVQQVVLPAFEQASRGGDLARDASGKPYPLELVPGYYRAIDHTTVRTDGPHYQMEAGEVPPAMPEGVTLAPASYTLMHYAGEPKGDNDRPSAELANRTWAVVKSADGQDVVVRTDEQGNETERQIAFETTLGAPHFVRIRKTFALSKLDFHVRMKLQFFATEGLTPPPLHYQIAGPRNVPIEGEWYTPLHRHAIIGCKSSSGSAHRAIADSALIVTEHGSAKYTANSDKLPGDFTFTAVINQFFAAALCIAPDQPAEQRKEMWKYVRATREWQAQPLDTWDTKSLGWGEQTSPAQWEMLAQERQAFYADKPQLGEITVRAVSKPVKPTPDGVEHGYWLYHGPTKVRLLKSLNMLDTDQRKFVVDEDVVENKYLGDLSLNVITDAPSPNWFGNVAGAIGWTGLVVWFTNRMHDVLGWMHGNVLPVWGLNILMLTVLVRLLLMLPSRRQQAGMIKMQEKMAAMKPELEKLQEKYKSDPQRLNQEKTKLMLQHGVNPLSSMGGCLLMFAQMPVFLGLYYCLQESIFFRLDQFLWIKNLAAPDMLFTWSESIPFISTADQIGHSWYLGPYVNILPVLAVSLMYLNFKISSPPPTDEQQEMSQRMMKFMMLFMGVFFYKMAAGLCVYFICSTLWGMTERWLLKRKKKAREAVLAATGETAGPSLQTTTKPTAPAGPPKPPGFFDKVKQGLLEKLEEAQRQAESKGQTITNNPQQKSQPKPPPGGPPYPGVNGAGKKKKRKK